MDEPRLSVSDLLSRPEARLIHPGAGVGLPPLQRPSGGGHGGSGGALAHGGQPGPSPRQRAAGVGTPAAWSAQAPRARAPWAAGSAGGTCGPSRRASRPSASCRQPSTQPWHAEPGGERLARAETLLSFYKLPEIERHGINMLIAVGGTSAYHRRATRTLRQTRREFGHALRVCAQSPHQSPLYAHV